MAVFPRRRGRAEGCCNTSPMGMEVEVSVKLKTSVGAVSRSMPSALNQMKPPDLSWQILI